MPPTVMILKEFNVLLGKYDDLAMLSPQACGRVAADGGSPRMKSGNAADLSLGSLSSKELVMKAMELNKDPVIAEIFLSERIPKDLSDTIKEEQRRRSIVIANLEEADAQLRPSQSILDLVKVECRPVNVYRMGAYSNTRPRLVKVILPTSFHWRQALHNAHLLRHSSYKAARLRKSMTPEELKKSGNCDKKREREIVSRVSAMGCV
ncbi:unnamed protein product [Heligmosomoides polygyrus]|uniref:Uncharacterized protein n=1 Tax=Heligmosomoides polygyrus TaxID=6339 RepID=A0A3P8HG11_HELPZ|nr:unnamed protein product [Heligmosomoides polygyrus]